MKHLDSGLGISSPKNQNILIYQAFFIKDAIIRQYEMMSFINIVHRLIHILLKNKVKKWGKGHSSGIDRIMQ